VEASSQSEFVTAATQDDLLDEMSLQTVLDMLAVMVAVEELTQLESLTPEQKRQVWTATPEDVKLRLKELKASGQAKSPPIPPTIEWATEEKEGLEELGELEESEELAELDELNEMGEAIDYADENISVTNLPLFQNSYSLDTPLIEQKFQVGDYIVLKAEPRLTAAELVAVWKVIAIEGEQARIEAKGLASRQYPMSWMISYPSDELEF
jgi:hypothetical protein